MDTLLTNYQLDRPTWFYLSLLLIVALFFRFRRVASLRNVDLVLLLAPTPGLLMVRAGWWSGYLVLLATSAVILVRVLCDPLFRRRPRTPQNLNTPGLAFLAIACGMFHAAEIATIKGPYQAMAGPAISLSQQAPKTVEANGTGPSLPPAPDNPGGVESFGTLARMATILAHLGVVAALLVLGWRGFGDFSLGVAMAALYLLLPYTAYEVAQLDYIVPAALILWAAVNMRRPLISGALMGLACGTVVFPLFLLPVWLSFYGFKSSVRFLAALATAWIVLFMGFTLATGQAASLTGQLAGVGGLSLFDFSGIGQSGVWEGIHGVWRLPVLVLFFIMLGLLCWWPRHRSMEHLLSRLTAVIVAVQFWYPLEGGVYLLWYAPLLIALIFRPVLTRWKRPSASIWPQWRRTTQPAAARVERGGDDRARECHPAVMVDGTWTPRRRSGRRGPGRQRRAECDIGHRSP